MVGSVVVCGSLWWSVVITATRKDFDCGFCRVETFQLCHNWTKTHQHLDTTKSLAEIPEASE